MPFLEELYESMGKEFSDLFSTNKKLNCHVICQKCSSLVLCKNDARLYEEKFPFPDVSTASVVTLNLWWKVDDMFSLKNVGFRKFSDKTKVFLHGN